MVTNILWDYDFGDRKSVSGKKPPKPTFNGMAENIFARYQKDKEVGFDDFKNLFPDISLPENLNLKSLT